MMKRKVIAAILISFMVTLLPLQALALKPEGIEPPVKANPVNYLNLGDSIANGMSAEKGQSYFDLYSAYKLVGPSVDLSVPGATTGDLLAALETDRYQNAVKRADVIIISIGGNNLLQPIQDWVQAYFAAAGLQPDLMDPDDIQAAIEAIALANSLPPEVVWNVMGSTLIWEAATPGQPLNAALMNGAAVFGPEWMQIHAAIRALNQDANVIALTLYNPFELSNPLYGLFESIASGMNGGLGIWSAANENCYLADIYTAFQPIPDAVDFSLALDTVNLDIHPTTTGHAIIFDELTDLDIVDEFQPPKGK